MLHHIARQVLGQRLAYGLAPLLRGGGFIRLWRRCFRHLLLEVAEYEFELLERTAQFLRRGAEPLA